MYTSTSCQMLVDTLWTNLDVDILIPRIWRETTRFAGNHDVKFAVKIYTIIMEAVVGYVGG